jgi:hypothetical protein
MRGWSRVRKAPLLGLLGLTACYLPGLAAIGQTPAAADARPAARAGYKKVSLDDQVKHLAASLNLTEGQQLQLRTILAARQAQTFRIREDDSISGEERIGQLRSLQDTTVARIRAMLNDEQRKQYDPLMVRQAQRSSSQASVDEWMKAIRKQ